MARGCTYALRHGYSIGRALVGEGDWSLSRGSQVREGTRRGSYAERARVLPWGAASAASHTVSFCIVQNFSCIVQKRPYDQFRKCSACGSGRRGNATRSPSPPSLPMVTIMDRSSLNRAIGLGLCLSAIRRATGTARDCYRAALRCLNTARARLSAGNVAGARAMGHFAMVHISIARLARRAVA